MTNRAERDGDDAAAGGARQADERWCRRTRSARAAAQGMLDCVSSSPAGGLVSISCLASFHPKRGPVVKDLFSAERALCPCTNALPSVKQK